MSSTSPLERRYVTAAEAAEFFGVHPKTLKNWVNKGVLKAYRLPGGTLLRFDMADLEAAFIDANRLPSSEADETS